MNSAVFSHLPRFHPQTDRQPADWLRILASGDSAPPETEVPLPVADISAPVVAAVPAPEAAPPAADGAALEAAVRHLAGLAARLEAEARSKAAETLKAMAAEVLPELSRAFLADEIMRHLPALVPVSVPHFEIRAEPGVASRLGELAATHPALAGRFDVVPEEGAGAGRAEISWRTGGVTFETEKLIQACLARLRAAP
ncbi:hypothetical protein [Hyphomonas sp.]|uniref:hypothetical protein n=1 Tax=Hyphomonas sp. TaxID=87 RepID=UPI0039188B55